MDFEGRLRRAREEMRERGVGLMYLRRGAKLWYLAGIRRRGPEMTDHNTYGDYVQGAYIGAEEGFVLVGPRMGSAAWVNEAEGKPWVDELRIIDESETPEEVLEEVLEGFDVKGGVMVDERAWAHASLLIRKNLPGSEMSLASEIIDPMKMIKDDDEIARMKKIGEITDEVYGEVVKYLRVGLKEEDVAHEVDYQFTKHGSEQNSFVTGVRFRSPKRPSRPHALRSTSRTLQEGDAVTFDFGGVYQGYCSDFGRTVYVGDPPAKVREIHDTVMAAQAAAIERMVDGTITAKGLDRVARGIIEDKGYGECFGHRLGHGIGVTVHEPPFLYIPDETVLRKGMTFTMEPSILLPDSWAARVEDVVMVTEEGGVPFSNYHKELTTI
ncbi:M24 family metallopeptidase [Candidatus Bathyarchaeota archaeon]|nr:M24 family metallopeptidase [Candidatus Bathyarchaeota archaeon]